MSIYGLADCNNFFVSCERVFRPALEGRPAVVLSSNDGCIVARSDEAKALGVKMAQPAFQAKDLIERHSIAVISGNLPFYTDMSNRVMQAFGELVPAVEKYSIDECFLDLTGMPQELTAFCQGLKHTVRQWTGLPISIGIAETKTLAKIANRLAKTSAKTNGVLDLTGERWRDRALASTEVGNIWGIGRQYAQKLNRNGIMTALDLTSRPDGWVRKEMGVGGLKTVRELRGEDCIGFDDMPQPKQTTMVSRSFGAEVRDYDELANAIAMFATDAARSIRRANLVSTSVSVFIETNRFGRSPHHAPSRSEALSPATNNTRHVVRAALTALKHIYREGLAYKRAGVMLLDLVEAGQAQVSLFDTQDPRDDKLIEAFDAINDRLGPGAIQFGPAAQGAALAIEQRLPLALLHNPLGRHPEGQDLSTDRPGRRSGRRPTSWKLHNRRAAPARPWHATERMSPGPFGRRGRGRENGFRRPAGKPRMTYSKTAAIRTAIAVIAALFRAGCMSGDHGVKRMTGAEGSATSQGGAQVHSRKRQARDRGHGSWNHGGAVSR